MKKIGVITDASACLNFIDFKHDSVKVIDFAVVINQVSHKISELDSEEYYRKMKEFRELMTIESKAKFIKNVDRIEELAWKLHPKYERQVIKRKKKFNIKWFIEHLTHRTTAYNAK